jgi:hypothetical protein
MYKSSLRHIYDPVLSSLKMKGIPLFYFAFCILSLFNSINVGIGHTCNTMRVKHDTIITCATAECFCLYLCSPTPSTTRSQTCAYITRVAVNASGVTSMGHEVREGHTKKRALRHIHVKNVYYFLSAPPDFLCRWCYRLPRS